MCLLGEEDHLGVPCEQKLLIAHVFLVCTIERSHTVHQHLITHVVLEYGKLTYGM